MNKNKSKFFTYQLILVFISLIFLNSVIIGKNLKLIKEKIFTVKSGELLTLKTDVGDVIIKTWDKEEALVKIYGDTKAKQKMEFIFDQDEKGIYVEGEKEGGKLFGWFSSVDLKYEIILPKIYDLNLTTSGGDIMTYDIEGSFVVKTSGGDIYMKEVLGSLDAGTSGGDITLKSYAGDSKVSTSGGDIEVNSKYGNVSASTSGGDVYIKTSDGEVKAKSSGGDITLYYNGENKGISLVTSGGDIDVVVPQDLSADVDIKTSGGDISNDFSKNKMTKVTKSKLIGTFNNGGAPLICKTSGGDINLKEK